MKTEAVVELVLVDDAVIDRVRDEEGAVARKADLQQDGEQYERGPVTVHSLHSSPPAR